MRRSHNEKNFYWSKKCDEDDDGQATVLTVVSRLDNSTPSKFTTKNIFRLNKSSYDEKKIYFGPSNSKNPCGVRIYIKNENNITNYNTGPPPSKSHGYTEPIIMPSFNSSNNNRQRSNDLSKSFKTSIDSSDSDYSKPKSFSSTQRAMSFLKKDLLSNRNDFAFLKKPVVQSNKDPPIFQPLKTPIVSPRRSEFLSDFPVNKEPFQPLRRNFSECLSTKHRPPPWYTKTVQNKQVQTETTRNDLPLLRPSIADINKNRSTLTTQQQQQQQLQQTTTSSSNNTESSLFLKKQESSNFSMFKGMNSNDLYNYIDDVINQFRVKTKLLVDEEEDEYVHNNNNNEQFSEFSDTIFYPEDQETTATATTATTTSNRDDTMGGYDLKRAKRSERLNVHELSTIMSSEDENEIVVSSSDQNFLESKPFSNSKDSPNEDLDEGESSTFINYTHSMEIDDGSNDDDDDDETLDDDK